MSTALRNPPFRAEHVGSLLRPAKLLDKRHAIQQGKDNDDGLRGLEDEAISEAVKMQTDIGFDAITDGEYRRHMFWGTFFPDLNGMQEISNPSIKLFRTYMADVAAFMQGDHMPGESIICTGKISHPGRSSCVDQYEYLKSITPKEQHGAIKLTLPGPNFYHLRYRDGHAYSKDVYATDEDYFADLARAFRTELQILYDAGVRNVQVDDVNYMCA